jgi:CubicO group peptidase (beta-lactamase class C family)
MSLTRREFLRRGGSGLAAGPVIACFGCSQSREPARGAGTSSWGERTATLEKRIRQSMNDHHVPGASVAIIRDARIAWKKSFGVRDRSTGLPVDDDTIFSAQSMSKPVFAYRVMKLSELGVLDLDAPLTRYTSDVFVRNDPRLNDITARRVLSHTTGLPNWRAKDDPLRINFTPGTKWSYSGEGYHYLQSVVTRLTGHIDESHCGAFEMDYRVCATDFGEYMETNLLRPFAMTHSGYVLTPAMQQAAARPHDRNGEPLPQKPATALDVARYGSAGSLMTTASDYAMFLIEVMQPKPADDYRLREPTLREMLRPEVEAPSPIKTSWALGWQIWRLDGGDVVAHGGDIDGWHSLSVFSPVRTTGFVILTNGEGGSPMIWDELLQPLVAEFVFFQTVLPVSSVPGG